MDGHGPSPSYYSYSLTLCSALPSSAAASAATTASLEGRLLPRPSPNLKQILFPPSGKSLSLSHLPFCCKSKKTKLENYCHVCSLRASGIISDLDLKNLIDDLKENSPDIVWENVIDKSNNSISYKAKCCKPKVFVCLFLLFKFIYPNS